MKKLIAVVLSFALCIQMLSGLTLSTNAASEDEDNILSANNGASVRTVAIGEKIWSDRNYTFKFMPDCFLGNSYVQSNLASTNVDIVEDGYAYVITPLGGYGNSQAEKLRSLGYVNIDVPSWTMFETFTSELGVFEKRVNAGENIAIDGVWSVLISSRNRLDFKDTTYVKKELAYMKSLEGFQVKNVRYGEKVFSDRDYTFKEVPYYLAGMNYLCGSISPGNYTMEATQAGYVYCLTIKDSANAMSQKNTLLEQGFVEISIPQATIYEKQGDIQWALYEKYVNVGDTVTYGRYLIPFFSGELEEKEMAMLSANEGAQIMKLQENSRIYNDRTYALFNQLPTGLQGKSYLYAGIDGASGTVQKAGKVYVGIPYSPNYEALTNEVVGAGYTKSAYRPFTLSISINDKVQLYEKTVEVGETVSFGRWNIIIFETLENSEEYYQLPSQVESSGVRKDTEGTYDISTRNWQGCPTIERTEDGRLWAGWFTGGEKEPQVENYGVVSYSDDDGVTWKQYYVLDSVNEQISTITPNLWIDPSGNLHLFWAQGTDAPEADGQNVTWTAICTNPDAEEPEWSEPTLVGYGVTCNKPTIVSATGEWLIGTYTCGGLNPYVTHVYSSNDEGATWELKSQILDMGSFINESMMVELQDGTLWMLARTTYGYLSESYSYDHGVTWTNAVATDLASPNSRFHISRLESGKLLLINHYNFEGRSHLYAMLSDDDGVTWSHKLLLDERPGVSYPDAVQSSDGTIYVIYDHERYTCGHILMATFTEQDIIDGAFNSSVSCQKQILSSLYTDKVEEPENVVWTDDMSDSKGGHYTAYGYWWNNAISTNPNTGETTDYTGVLGNEGGAESGITYYYLNDYEFDDFVMEFDVVSATKDADYGVVLRAGEPGPGVDQANGYTIMYDGDWVFAGKLDGSFTKLEDTRWRHSYNPSQDGVEITHWKVVCVGDTLSVFFNNSEEPAIQVKDDTFSYGQVGFRTYAPASTASNVVIDNLIIKSKGEIQMGLESNLDNVGDESSEDQGSLGDLWP